MYPQGITGNGKKWKHEEGSVMMLKYLLSENNIMPSDLSLSDIDILFIEEIILGVKESDRRGRAPDKFYLYDIVNNIRSGIPVTPYFPHHNSLYLNEFKDN